MRGEHPLATGRFDWLAEELSVLRARVVAEADAGGLTRDLD